MRDGITVTVQRNIECSHRIKQNIIEFLLFNLLYDKYGAIV